MPKSNQVLMQTQELEYRNMQTYEVSGKMGRDRGTLEDTQDYSFLDFLCEGTQSQSKHSALPCLRGQGKKKSVSTVLTDLEL